MKNMEVRMHDLEGCDDDFIDDVLGGEPEAYWNID